MGYEHLHAIPAGDSLADAAYAQLGEAILRNELEPGTPLSVPELSRRMGISRSPVREAVQRLVYDGLADHHGRRGTFVSSIDVADFVALLEVREVLEGLAARMAAERASDGELDDLARMQEDFVALGGASDQPAATFVEFDMAFHQRILEMSRNAELGLFLARSQARAHLSMHSLWRGARNVSAVRAEHGEISRAITSRDPDRADAAARRHIAGLRRRVLDEAARATPTPQVTAL